MHMCHGFPIFLSLLMTKKMADTVIKGRGAQHNPANAYLRNRMESSEGEEQATQVSTIYLQETAKSIINKTNSPDLPGSFSMNPYQGCEHGCVYCYARPTHEYYGYSAGLDFESKIIVKHNAARLLRAQFEKKSWKPAPVMLSGNTDCYQPAEKKFGITRQILSVCLEYGNPVSIITKNALILRDLDILQELAAKNLVHVAVSVTTLQEELRRMLEPRTVTGQRRLGIINELSKAGIPAMVMASPMIPFLNSDELPEILKQAADNGALEAGFIVVRLNGPIGEIFETWCDRFVPDKKERILERIREMHGGSLEDRRSHIRMKGEGEFARMLGDTFRLFRQKYFADRQMPAFDYSHFGIPGSGQLSLF